MKQLNISILGCGWLGLPLLKSLVADGHTVKGSSRNPATLAAITAAGGEAFRINLPEKLPAGFTDECDVLIFTLPPGGRKFGEDAPKKYLEQLLSLAEWLSLPDGPAVIYTSSTGVYGNAEGVTTEESPTLPNTHSSRAVLKAEAAFASIRCPLIVLRLAGLVAEDRHPGRFFGGKDRPIPLADAPVNLVHRDDVIAAIKLCLSNNRTPVTYNVCAAAQPTKGDFYTRAANALGLVVKGTETGGEEGKVINSDKLRARGWKPVWDDLDLEHLEKKEKDV